MSIEVMKQALDALYMANTREWPENKIGAAINALQAAVEEAEVQQDMIVRRINRADEVIFKACVNLNHWKRAAMRHLKRYSPDLFDRAVNEFNEHPNGRGKRPLSCPHGMVDTCCGNTLNCNLGKNI